MATIGQIEAFSGNADDFECYMERLEQYLLANDLELLKLAADKSNEALYMSRIDKRRAVFISLIGGSAYSLLRNLVAPNKPADRSMEELVQALRDHYCPESSVTVQRYKFNTRVRASDESVATYVSQLRKLADDCQFGAALETQL